MSDKIEVLYNAECPVCRVEIDAYRRRAEKEGLAMEFLGLEEAGRFGLTADRAAQSLHLRKDGEVLEGVAAFRTLWSAMPGLRWLARLTGLPVVAPLTDWIYRRVLAPLLYRAHLRRQRRE
jgi:predicted DCC family thiol-disulfide oxidoreductase YuxK